MVVTNVGLNVIRDVLGGISTDYAKGIQLGDGTTTPVAGDTTLSGSATTSGGEVRVDSASGDTTGAVTLVLTLGTNEGNAEHKEVGVFDGTTGTGTDNLIARKIFTPFTKTSSFVYRIEYRFTFTRKTT